MVYNPHSQLQASYAIPTGSRPKPRPTSAQPRIGGQQELIQSYMARHRVFELLNSVTTALAIKRPDDPIAFMMAQLQEAADADRRPASARAGYGAPAKASRLAAIENKLAMGQLLSKDEMQELSSQALDASGASVEDLVRKIEEGQMLTDAEMAILKRS